MERAYEIATDPSRATSFKLGDLLVRFPRHRSTVWFLHLNVHGALLHSDRVFSSGEFFVSVFRSETKTKTNEQNESI